MSLQETAAWLISQEARSLLARLARVRPFALQETMTTAAALFGGAQIAIERFLANARRELRTRVRAFISRVERGGSSQSPEELQREFTILRLRFNILLSQVDIFSDAITQRSEHEIGVRLAGLDVLATDALYLPEAYYQLPPVVCYLDRGHGAAIRRARTRLPGGPENPVAIIRVPRERMVSGGIASSLVHEVGHQGAALLGLVESLRPILRGMQPRGKASVWSLWERWISEIIADFWSISTLGIGATLGLMAVVSLPRAFVFRMGTDDPHPFPWIRVKLSCAMGQALYPHPQWKRFADLWEAFYPTASLEGEKLRVLRALEQSMPAFVSVLVHHRPRSLKGKSLAEVIPVRDRSPAKLAAYFRLWRRDPNRMRLAPPSLALAVMGQARANAQISPEEESRVIDYLLTYWALQRTLQEAALASKPELSLARAAS